mmetsp:Transcript_27147/g.42453  ORF Transcript_27147/g.42453 Transcript_27147/m.42453 type:complete len:271 (-) Transcript_27147:117-929(-)
MAPWKSICDLESCRGFGGGGVVRPAVKAFNSSSSLFTDSASGSLEVSFIACCKVASSSSSSSSARISACSGSLSSPSFCSEAFFLLCSSNSCFSPKSTVRDGPWGTPLLRSLLLRMLLRPFAMLRTREGLSPSFSLLSCDLSFFLPDHVNPLIIFVNGFEMLLLFLLGESFEFLGSDDSASSWFVSFSLSIASLVFPSSVPRSLSCSWSINVCNFSINICLLASSSWILSSISSSVSPSAFHSVCTSSVLRLSFSAGAFSTSIFIASQTP